jgi:hypothetical protein
MMQVLIDEAIYAGFKVTKPSADGKKQSKVIHQFLHGDQVIKAAANAGTTEVAKIQSGTMVNVSIEGVTFIKQEFSDVFFSGQVITVHAHKAEKRA